MKDSPQFRWMRRTTLLCLVLLCLSGVAQVLHSHSQDLVRGDGDKTRCTVCVAGHAPPHTTAKVSIHPQEAREIANQAAASLRLTAIAVEASRIRPPPSL